MLTCPADHWSLELLCPQQHPKCPALCPAGQHPPASMDNVLHGHRHHSPATQCISDLLLGGRNQHKILIFLSYAGKRMDFSKITFASAFSVIHRKMDPVISILSLLPQSSVKWHLTGNKNAKPITQRTKSHVGSSPRHQCQLGEQAGLCMCQHRWGMTPSFVPGGVLRVVPPQPY